ncbi:FAD binding domain-containing protein [Aspergillus heteromorphus CBS 117.55]|uniref:FAD binding domain-containing protein n=1 Tax=Aspergillus heteromorphus CBS 117.55 TaxID=1448321 RepID=A0A317V8T0_9EURO|nr:FAD binding domain-containing protein [Aspergillus heteromorphus CBS 117.55]PWY69701.1 FAD binding domain-containing protein [Aspergillus heteromorphus CBS 117.55]
MKTRMLIVPALTGLAFAARALATADPGYNCRPGQKCWPSAQEWQQFNATIDGHLYQTVPIAAPCYKNSTYYDLSACEAVEDYYGDSIPRGTHFGQTYWLNWETCGNSGCALLESDPSQTLYGTCATGRLASYYVDVREASHTSAALLFAQKHNIRISVKNTGHDFFGRSSVPNSLAVWTKNLDTLDFFANFTAHNCPSANGRNIGEMGAGVVAGDAYEFFSSHGMDITGGYEQSVGLAGGFGQGGGVGSFTTTHGLMVDNAVEFDVVTADGQFRTINECNDPELFWAMRGGGGGTYAVLLKYRVQVFPTLPIHTYTFTANFTGVTPSNNRTEDVSLREILTAHAQHQAAWSAELVTGQIEYFPERVSVSLVLPYNDDGTKLKSATASFAQFLANRTDLSVATDGYSSYASYAAYLNVTTAVAKVTEPSGIFSLLASRLIPREVFTSPELIDALAEGVAEGIETARSVLDLTGTQVVLESPLSNPDLNETTSALPAWRNALWHVIHVGEWLEPLDADAHRNATDVFLRMLDPLKALSPGGGAYFNEAHFEEPDWQETYFGSFYDRLLKVKNDYDPTHLFDCWRCVGWRGEQE